MLADGEGANPAWSWLGQRLFAQRREGIIGLRGRPANHAVSREERKGYSISFEELLPGWFSIAAPIFNEKKEVVASIGVSGASIRFSKSKRINVISLVKEAANKISISIGF